MHWCGVGVLFRLVNMDSFGVRLTTTAVRNKIVYYFFKLTKYLGYPIRYTLDIIDIWLI